MCLLSVMVVLSAHSVVCSNIAEKVSSGDQDQKIVKFENMICSFWGRSFCHKECPLWYMGRQAQSSKTGSAQDVGKKTLEQVR